ncbi:beta-glucosidase 31-like [Asparagus officinalis]|nr:beta-glucosidase 31-like [Asparagus officinalis]
MHDMGLDAYRFSISWSRLIPDGHGDVNAKGLQYYNNLIDELVSYGIEPHVTLHHFDLPQALEDEYGGVLSPRIIEDFTAYADVCFREFGDRVKYWATFNEPRVQALFGYQFGTFPPRRCTHPVGSNCTKGGSTSEPYLAAHNLLRSHLSAATLYKDQYQAVQGGKIGITTSCPWYSPSTNSQEDIIAAQQARDSNIGWIINPLVYGDYPPIMRESLGSNLPSFDAEESMKLKQSFDFIGLNHYNLYYVKYKPNKYDKSDKDVKNVSAKDSDTRLGASEKFLTVKEASSANAPWAFQATLEYVKIKYRNPPIIVYENGYGESNVGPTTGNGTDDYKRVAYLQDYSESLLRSIRNGSNTLGYFVWSFLDCFELVHGYTARYGLYGVDFEGADRRRFARLSAHWYSKFLSNGGLIRARASKIIRTE